MIVRVVGANKSTANQRRTNPPSTGNRNRQSQTAQRAGYNLGKAQRGQNRRVGAFGWPGRRRRGWLYGPGWGYATVPGSPDRISWVQSCLSQAVGPWVPQNGIPGAATRRAIRTFQQQRLPVTGSLDDATTSALRSSCGDARSAASPPLPDTSTATDAPAGAALPESASPDAIPLADAPPEDSAGELGFLLGRRERDESEQEYTTDSLKDLSLTIEW